MQDFLQGLLRVSLYGSLAAVLLALLRQISASLLSRTVLYYLWLIVLLRLCIPAGITITLPDIYESAAQDDYKNTVQIPQDDAVFAQKEAVPAAKTAEYKNARTEPADQIPAENRPGLYELWAVIWGMGVLAFLGWQMCANLYFSRKVRRTMKEADAQAQAVLRELEPEGRVRLAESDAVNTPMLLGVFRPVIVLPEHMNGRTGKEVCKEVWINVIAHELVHAKRHDLLYKWFVRLVTSLHWFNPMICLIWRETDRCCELSCDEAVIRGMSAQERRQYGQTLLDLAGAAGKDRHRHTAALCREKAWLKERLVSIGRYQKKGKKAVLCTLPVMLAVSGCAVISDVRIGKMNDAPAHISQESAENQSMDTDTDDRYLSVFREKEPFLYYAQGQNTAESMKLTDILDVFSKDSSLTKIDRFAVVDLDGDGSDEIVMQIADVGMDMGGFLILRQEHGNVLGYPANYKMITSLKKDGTFVYISPARPDDGIGTIQFHENGYEMLSLAGSETDEENQSTVYYSDQKPVSGEEYLAVRQQQESKTDAAWYPFTEEGMRQAFMKPAQSRDGKTSAASGTDETQPQPALQDDSAGQQPQPALQDDSAGQQPQEELTDEKPELYYEKNGRQYELVPDLVTGEYLWANVLTKGRLVKDDHGHEKTDHYSQEHFFERLDGNETYTVRRWDNLLYSAGEYLIFEYDGMVHVSKRTDLYHPVLSYEINGTYGIITKIPQGYMTADYSHYKICYYDEKFRQIKVVTGLRAGGTGIYYVDGLMAVRDMKTGKMGFLDYEGNMAIPCQYAQVSDFSNGYASVLTDAEIIPYTEDGGTVQMYYGKGGQWGIIDRKGQFVLEPSDKYANENPQNTDDQYSDGIRRFGPVREDGTVDFLASDEDDRVLETVRVK